MSRDFKDLVIFILILLLGFGIGILSPYIEIDKYEYINTEPNQHGAQWVMLYLYKGEAKYLYFDFKKTMDEFIKTTGMTGYKEAE